MSDVGLVKSIRLRVSTGLSEQVSNMSLRDKGLKVSTLETYDGSQHKLEEFLL